MTRARQAPRLVRPLLATGWWAALPAAGAVAVALLSLDGPALLELRLAALAVCVGAAFALDDAAAETIASSPTPLLFRRLVRVALVVPLVAALWLLVLWYADADAGAGVAWALTLELAAMLAVALAAAALAIPRVPDGRGGLAAGPALLLLAATAALAVPDRWTLFAWGPEDPRWVASHWRWAGVLLLAVLALLHASRDPGRRRLRLSGSRRSAIRAAASLAGSDAAVKRRIPL